MMIHVTNKPIVFVVAAIMLFMFCTAPSAHAAVILIVPAVGFAIWGIATAIMGVAAGIDTARDGRSAVKEQVKPIVPDRQDPAEDSRLELEFHHDAG